MSARVKTYRVALSPGDGIRSEVVDATLPVLEAVAGKLGGFQLACERFDWGMARCDRHGGMVPDDFLAAVERAPGARNLTPDVGGMPTTAQITEAVVGEIR